MREQFADIVYTFWLQKRSEFENFAQFTLILGQSVWRWGGARRHFAGFSPQAHAMPSPLSIGDINELSVWITITPTAPRSGSASLVNTVGSYLVSVPLPVVKLAEQTDRPTQTHRMATAYAYRLRTMRRDLQDRNNTTNTETIIM